MGYITHNAIIVTTYDEVVAQKAQEYAINLGLQVTAMTISKVNAYYTFFACPSGSKYGWPPQKENEEAREKFCGYLMDLEFSDKSSPVEWVEVRYGSDDAYNDIAPEVTNHAWKHKFPVKE